MTVKGTQLGVDLFDLYAAGHTQLPDAASSLRLAWDNVPVTVSFSCARGGGLGIGPNGPGPTIDGLLDELNDVLLKGANHLDETGTALVWLAGEYAKTDHAAAAELHRLQQLVPDH